MSKQNLNTATLILTPVGICLVAFGNNIALQFVGAIACAFSLGIKLVLYFNKG